MNECVRRREQRQLCGKNWSALDKLMISPQESKVKRSRCPTVSKLSAAGAKILRRNYLAGLPLWRHSATRSETFASPTHMTVSAPPQ